MVSRTTHLMRRAHGLWVDRAIRDLAIGLGLIGGSVVLLAAAIAGSGWLFMAIALAAVTVRVLTTRRTQRIDALLAGFGVEPLYRHVIRDAAVLALVYRSGLDAPALAFTAGALGLVWLAALATAVGGGLLGRLVPPVLSRNLGLDPPALSAIPSAGYWSGHHLLDLSTPLTVAVPLAVITSSTATVATAAVAVAVVAVAAAVRVVAAVGRALPARRSAGQVGQVGQVGQASVGLRAAHPQVMLYSPGEVRDAYQVNMWLPTLGQLRERAVVVVRDRKMFKAIAETTVPVLCIPNTVDLINFGFDTVRVVLYPGNFGENIQMLRQPGRRHVFIGHGDSDKMASANPFSRVYDEVWVAGRAGRARYALADVGVRDRDIVEVGRPQLDGLTVASSHVRPVHAPLSVLYAPTWEGWLESDQRSSSLARMGERLVGALLATAGVRVIYRPHPLSGSRLRAARQADTRIRTMLLRAGGTEAERSAPLNESRHLVVKGPTPDIYDCFNASDLLITDVSSVLVDYVKTQKPCVVANAFDIAASRFRAEVPSAGAAYLLSADCANLPEILADVRTGDDVMKDGRRKLQEYLLGADETSALARFQHEIARLCGNQRTVRGPAPGSAVPTTRSATQPFTPAP